MKNEEIYSENKHAFFSETYNIETRFAIFFPEIFDYKVSNTCDIEIFGDSEISRS